jgi:indole-3-glycerol phosphate synthase
MSTILDRIVAHKQLEVERRRERYSVDVLRESVGYSWPRRSLSNSIRNSQHFGIIAEFKRKSPSQQDINLGADPAKVTAGYARAGAAGISCLTDVQFFGAHPTDIDVVRQTVDLPVIRKDFIVDPYQIHEARAMGADAILLIAACLSAQQLDELASEAKSLGLEVLCEVHSAEEVSLISPHVDIVGVNNRNLKDFSVSIATSLALAEMLPADTLKISESGIEDPQSIVRLKRAGFSGFLIGTYFMRQEEPGGACADFIREVHKINELYDGAIA